MAAEETKREKRRSSDSKGKRIIKRLIIFFLCAVICLLAACQLAYRILPDNTMLAKPADAVTSLISPVQTGFSFLVDKVVDYLYTLKLRSRIELEYNTLREENEELRNEVMLLTEMKNMLSQYQGISDEVRVNEMLNPIPARVIARESGNYFSVFTINVGSRDGVEDYMAVTMDGSLIGYTYNVQSSSSTVRTIIDSEASIAALISTSRDQGTVRGTLNVDGNPLCRMYYLPDDQLPRPGDLVVTSGVGMSFPKGIPIGSVRESTRGMESNKSYVVVEPQADFEHIERVIVLRYQPDAVEVESRASSNDTINISRLDTPRPVPTVHIGSEFFQLAPTIAPTSTPEPEYIIDENGNQIMITPAPMDDEGAYEYQVPVLSSTDGSFGFTVSPSATPSPTPAPLDMSVEDDD